MRKFIQLIAVSLSIIAFTAGTALFSATSVNAEILDTTSALEERFLGDPNAPLTIYEYSSLGCSHCKSFHEDTLPMVMAEFIDTGKVRLVYRDYPLGNRAMAAAMIARCAPQERYFGMIALFFQKQADWSQAEDAVGALASVARFGGLSHDDVVACLQNQELLNGIRAQAIEGRDEYDVAATPTFVIGENASEKIEGTLGPDAFREILEEALN